MIMADGTIYISDRIGSVFGVNLAVTRNGQFCATMKEKLKTFKPKVWNVVVGPGIDPCLMIAFIAIVNEFD